MYFELVLCTDLLVGSAFARGMKYRHKATKSSQYIDATQKITIMRLIRQISVNACIDYYIHALRVISPCAIIIK
jgi:hypothetical protein